MYIHASRIFEINRISMSKKGRSGGFIDSSCAFNIIQKKMKELARLSYYFESKYLFIQIDLDLYTFQILTFHPSQGSYSFLTPRCHP